MCFNFGVTARPVAVSHVCAVPYHVVSPIKALSGLNRMSTHCVSDNCQRSRRSSQLYARTSREVDWSAMPVTVISREGKQRSEKITQILGFHGLTRVEVESASAGDIVAFAGIAEPTHRDSRAKQRRTLKRCCGCRARVAHWRRPR